MDQIARIRVQNILRPLADAGCRRPFACTAALALVTTLLFALPENTLAQSGGGREPIAPIPRKERAPDISQVARNVSRDPANLIADVRFRGLQFIQEHELTRNIGTRPGRYFDPDQLQQDVDRLWKLSKIKRVNGPFIDKTSNGMVITFDVVERQTIRSLEFIGNRGLTDRALKKESDLEVNQPLDLHKIRMAKNRIEEMYKEKGYPRTQVEILNVDEVEQGNVQFLIHEDQKQRVWKVEFAGNQFVSGARLKNFVNSKPGILKVFGGVANEREIEQDIVRLESYYKSFGFFNARIGREIEQNDNGQWLTIRYIIDEGPRYKIRNVSFIGNRVFTAEQLDTQIGLKPENNAMPSFNVAKMNEDVVSLRDLYGSQGFIHSNVEAEPRFLEEPGALDIVYRISEGKQYRVGKINVHMEGDFSVTKREVALKRLSLATGDWIDVREIRASERRLGASQIFADASGGPGTAPPRIVVKPPELQELERTANEAAAFGSSGRNSGGSSGSSSRGSSTRYR